VQGEKILGIITEKDITKNIANSTKKVSSVMTKQITTIDPNENIEEAAIIMSKNKIKHMPVVNKNSKLLGIITSTDILKHSEDLDDDFLFD
jgi:CBS domain-containing protein